MCACVCVSYIYIYRWYIYIYIHYTYICIYILYSYMCLYLYTVMYLKNMPISLHCVATHIWKQFLFVSAKQFRSAPPAPLNLLNSRSQSHLARALAGTPSSHIHTDESHGKILSKKCCTSSMVTSTLSLQHESGTTRPSQWQVGPPELEAPAKSIWKAEVGWISTV